MTAEEFKYKIKGVVSSLFEVADDLDQRGVGKQINKFGDGSLREMIRLEILLFVFKVLNSDQILNDEAIKYLVLVMALLIGDDLVYAGHRSHSSGSGGHGSHSSHESHFRHVSSSTHNSHSNATTEHSNHGSHSSHSSSFTVTIDIELKNGETLSLSMVYL